MSEAAVVAERRERVVDKKGLCAELGWSRMKLDRRLEEDGAFPVLARGGQGAPWSFDVDAVTAYLQPAAAPATPAPAPAPAPTPVKAAHTGEETARQRRDAAQAQLLEDKIRRSRGELVETGPLVLALSEAVTRTSTQLNALADVLVRRLNLPESALPIIRQEVDGCRRQLVSGLREYLTGE